MSDRLKALADAGVSIWLDDLSRERIETGNLADLVKEKSVVGVTTNPTIFAGAIADGERYDEQVRGAGRRRASPSTGWSSSSPPRTSATPATSCAPVADGTLRPTAGSRSRSSPTWPTTPRAPSPRPGPCGRRCERPNALIKIPATKEGLPAITAAIAEGISVNVTLIFGLERYREVMDAYLTGLEQAREAGLDLSTIQSVASFFVSRVDTEVDKRLDAIGTDEAQALKGKAAVANARLAYAAFEEVFASDRWQQLADAGAHRAAPAVGLHRREEPGLPRHAVRHRARRRRHGQHDAREDAWTPSPTTARSPATRSPAAADDAQPVFDGLAAVGIDFDDVLAGARARGRRQVQEVVDRARRDGPRPDGEGGKGQA